jgi:hypothetical protein
MGSRLESGIEKAFVQWCKDMGFKQRKLQDLGKQGYPDRTIYRGDGRTGCIEFKKPGGKPSPLQTRTAQQLCNLGIPVLITDDLETAKQWTRNLLSGIHMDTSTPQKSLSSTARSGRVRKGAAPSSSTRGSAKPRSV